MLTDLEKNAIRDHYRAISENLPQFRPRAAQREMIAAVANAFARSKPRIEGEEPPKREGESIAVIEGPTGVGKSLSYLLAGGIMAQTRDKRLIVSSATVALQEQLVNRDLPFLVEKSGLELTFALAKGRGRYLCPYKLYQLTQTHAQGSLAGFDSPPSVLWDSKPSASDLDTLRRMADEFAARRFNGDRDTWPESILDPLWQQVTNDRHGCLKNACPNRAECPFYLARNTAAGRHRHGRRRHPARAGKQLLLHRRGAPPAEKGRQPLCRRTLSQPGHVDVGKTAARHQQNRRPDR